MSNRRRFTGALLILGVASVFCATMSFVSLNRLTREEDTSLSHRLVPVEPTELMDINSLLRIPSEYPRVFVLPVVFRLPPLASTHGDLYVKQETDSSKSHWYFRTSPVELAKEFYDDSQITESEREKRATKLQALFGVSRPSENVFLRWDEGPLRAWSESTGQKDINNGQLLEDFNGLLNMFSAMGPFVTPTIEQFDKGWLKTYYPTGDEIRNATKRVTWQAPEPVTKDQYFVFAYQKGQETNTTLPTFIYRGPETLGMASELFIMVGDGATPISLSDWEKPFSNETAPARTG